jgi:hypothetical protein
MVATVHLQDEIIIENNHIHDRSKFGTYHGSGITLWTDHVTIRGNRIHDLEVQPVLDFTKVMVLLVALIVWSLRII